MRCPRCHNRTTIKTLTETRRRRHCLCCQHTFYTIETEYEPRSKAINHSIYGFELIQPAETVTYAYPRNTPIERYITTFRSAVSVWSRRSGIRLHVHQKTTCIKVTRDP
jgi:hypothetical protein